MRKLINNKLRHIAQREDKTKAQEARERAFLGCMGLVSAATAEGVSTLARSRLHRIQTTRGASRYALRRDQRLIRDVNGVAFYPEVSKMGGGDSERLTGPARPS